jgi:hypothetical protein
MSIIESGSSLAKERKMRAYSFVFRLGVLLCLVFASVVAAGWKWVAMGH